MKPYAAKTHVGKVREHNEDCISSLPDNGVWVLADGVGGHIGGEVASRIACEQIGHALNAGADLKSAIEMAHEAVLTEIEASAEAHAKHNDAQPNMGSTVVVLQTDDGDNFRIGWVGDSRAYCWNGNLQQLTTDHTVVAKLVVAGVISAEQARTHPEKNVLTQSLGVSRNMQLHVDVVQGCLASGESIILCSDGLTDEVSDTQIANIMQGNSSPDQQVDELLQAALASGGRDNVSVIVVTANTTAGDLDNKPQRDNWVTKRRYIAGISVIALLALAVWLS